LSQIEDLLPVLDDLGLLEVALGNKQLLLNLIAPLLVEPAPLLLGPLAGLIKSELLLLLLLLLLLIVASLLAFRGLIMDGRRKGWRGFVRVVSQTNSFSWGCQQNPPPPPFFFFFSFSKAGGTPLFGLAALAGLEGLVLPLANGDGPSVPLLAVAGLFSGLGVVFSGNLPLPSGGGSSSLPAAVPGDAILKSVGLKKGQPGLRL
jgi:hypothetical protein